MSPQARQTLWCSVILVMGVTAIVSAVAFGFAVDWDLLDAASVLPGVRGSAGLVVPSLLLIGVAAVTSAIVVLRLPADRVAEPRKDDE